MDGEETKMVNKNHFGQLVIRPHHRIRIMYIVEVRKDAAVSCKCGKLGLPYTDCGGDCVNKHVFAAI